MESIFYLILLPALLVLIEFIWFLLKGKQILNTTLLHITEIASFIILPWLYLDVDGYKNDCCSDSAVFSPKHQLTMMVLIVLCTLAYFYSSFRTKMAPPVIEILVNCLLLAGILLNIVIAIHVEEGWFAALGNIPIILLAILVLIKNQKVFMQSFQDLQATPGNKLEAIAWKILQLQPVLKYPIILILCLPVLSFIMLILLLFGQKPDSIIRAFTETYKHGLSQWDYKCDNVECGGHYLCSVAAGGHQELVKPKRLGARNGNLIICNRQLLISNAFEDLLQERLPGIHKFIRKQYNKVGDFTHKYYKVFSNKIISDLVYVLMKPLEWSFLLMLYTFDRAPENRIAIQYLSSADKDRIANSLSHSKKQVY